MAAAAATALGRRSREVFLPLASEHLLVTKLLDTNLLHTIALRWCMWCMYDRSGWDWCVVVCRCRVVLTCRRRHTLTAAAPPMRVPAYAWACARVGIAAGVGRSVSRSRCILRSLLYCCACVLFMLLVGQCNGDGSSPV